MLKELTIAGALATLVSLPETAVAQAQDPDDAFGQRTGIEQAGLYNEAAARGFDLSSSNVYRLEDTYFVRTSPLPDPVLSRVSVKAGIAAARTALPSPSGVIEYSLRRPAGNGLSVAAGFRDYWSPFLDLNATAVAGPVAVAAGALVQPDLRFADGTEGRYWDVGMVVRAAFSATDSLTAFASASSRRYGGNFAFIPGGDTLPEVLPIRESFSPEWADYRASLANQGLMLTSSPSRHLTLRMSAHRSSSRPEILDFTLFRLTDGDHATATLFRTGPRRLSGLAAEASVERRIQRGETRHKLSASVRARRSVAVSPSSTIIPLGTVDLDDRRYPDDPGEPSAQFRTHDEIRQVTLTGTYSAQVADRLELRTGLSVTRSRKDVTRPDGSQSADRSVHRLPFGSAIWSPGKRLSLFVSYVAGLEDTGLAPQGAVNANEVLPPVRSEQWEVGSRLGIGPGLTASVAGFSISKEVPGLDSARTYAFIGKARHRGIEAALAGRIAGKTSVLLGAVAMQAKVDRPEGVITAPGVSEQLLFLRLDRTVGSRLTLDAQLAYQGPRFLDIANRIGTDAQVTVNAGLRYRTRLGALPAEFRISGANLFDRLEWVATPGGTLLRTPPRTVRAILTLKP